MSAGQLPVPELAGGPTAGGPRAAPGCGMSSRAAAAAALEQVGHSGTTRDSGPRPAVVGLGFHI